MSGIKVLSVFGTRPDAVKMAPLVLELQKRPEIDSKVCITAQHRELLDGVLDVFGISADFDLDIMSENQTLSDITARVLSQLGKIYSDERPDIVLVHGDTTTAFVSALAAFYEKIKVGHVEAGLRSYNKLSPYPEEMNRLLVARLADLHFSPTAGNAENLRREGITGGIYITGNTVIDAVAYTSKGAGFLSPALKNIDWANKKIVTMTCHRRENYGESMENIFTAIRTLADKYEDSLFVYPVHPAPTVKKTAEQFLGGHDRIMLIEPLNTMDMHRLMAASYIVMTDSGGLQEEAPALGKPVLVLRRETERPEAVAAGTVKLAGVGRDDIINTASLLFDNLEEYSRMARAANPYGDGKACGRIADAILHEFGLKDIAPEEFSIDT